MARQTLRVTSKPEPLGNKLDLTNMLEDERQLFFEVVKGSLIAMNQTNSLGHAVRQETFFRSMTRSSLTLATMYVQEYQKFKANGSNVHVELED